MSGMNKVILIGNLGRDPETRNTNSGSTVTKLNLAVGERRKNQAGEWEDHTEWIRCVCFGKTATNADRFLRKGSKVAIEGKIRTTKWQDKEGNDRWTTEVVVDRLTFLDSKKDREERGGGYSGGSGGGYSGGSGGGYSGGGGVPDDDDIPF